MYVGTAFLPGWLVDLEGVLSDPLCLMWCSVTKMRLTTPILAAAAALLVPQAAAAATLEPLAGCYRSVGLAAEDREQVPVRASGFTPGQKVNVYVDGGIAKWDVIALPDGSIQGEVDAPYQESGERPFTVTVTQVDQPANTATTGSRVAALSLRIKPRNAAPSRRVRILGRGFIDGTEVFAHYVRKGKLRKTVSLGAPEGPCGRVDVKRRQIPVRKPALGRWTLQVDNVATYSATPNGVTARWLITVRRAVRPAPY